MVSTSKKVCVVGAGASGLVSARELRREGHVVTVMEQSGGVGGQWLYEAPRTDGGDDDPLGVAGVHSSVYASLRINFPRVTSSFSDFPFYPRSDGGGDPRRYPGHGEVLRYIRDFCDAFGLMDAVRLNTRVVHVGLASPCADDDSNHGEGGGMRWLVRCISGEQQGQQAGGGGSELLVTTTEEVFDAVVVAVGQFTEPRIPPDIKGMDTWRRRHLHSHSYSYRVPDPFHDQVVVLVGCNESGKEIALELREVAREVHVSVKSMDDDGAAVAPGMKNAVSRHHNLHLHGYNYWFPFLDTGGVVTVNDNRMGPLFEHTFPPALAPSLSFVGIPNKVVTPLFYEAQARWVAQVLAGRRRRRRCCAPSRSTTAPGTPPACPGATRTPSSTWTTATSSGRSTAASCGSMSGRRRCCGPPWPTCVTTGRASVTTTTTTATSSATACVPKDGLLFCQKSTTRMHALPMSNSS